MAEPKKEDAFARMKVAAQESKDKKDEELEPEAKTRFTDEDVEEWIEAHRNSPIASPLCTVFYGHDGTAKSGAAMDCRTPEEIQEGWMVFVIDYDGSALPLWEEYWNRDPNMIVLDPIMMTEEGKIDYQASIEKALAMMRWVRRQEVKQTKIKASVFDGIDTFLKHCEYAMKIEDLKLDPAAGIKDRWQWEKRNKRFQVPVTLLKHMRCHRFYTTHLKANRAYAAGELQVLNYNPYWEWSFPNMMFQKVLCEKLEEKDTVGNLIKTTFTAKVEKCKTNIELEGKTYTVAEVVKGGEAKWYGLHDFFAEAGKKQPIAEKVA